jgi:F0F1-type ATP synthase membrane subunit b/b'
MSEILEKLAYIWTQILQSNLFNFVLMICLLGWIIKKFDISAKLEEGRKHIEDRIALSKLEKENAIKTLFETQSDSKNVDKKVFDILERADKNATIVGEKLVQDGEKQAGEFSKNLQKTIKTNAEALKLDLTVKTAQTAIELAKNYIEDELKNDKSLHIKFINESIEALSGVEL